MKQLTAKNINQDLLNEMGSLEIGIFDATPIKVAKNKKDGLKSFGSSQARKIGNKQLNTTIADNLERLDKKFSFLEKPLEKNNPDVDLLVKTWVNYAENKNSLNENRVKNSLLATILKPIFNSFYGYNTKDTAKRKGFNKLMIDTSQTIKSLKVRLNKA